MIRPAVMFGPDDAFLTVILKLLQRLPAYPMFGNGMTKLQPAHVDDVAAGHLLGGPDSCHRMALAHEGVVGAASARGIPAAILYVHIGDAVLHIEIE